MLLIRPPGWVPPVYGEEQFISMSSDAVLVLQGAQLAGSRRRTGSMAFARQKAVSGPLQTPNMFWMAADSTGAKLLTTRS